MLAGIIVVCVMHSWVKPYPASVEYSWMQLLSLILWQPFFEEVLFRGIIQGQIRKQDWGKHSWLNISSANAITTVLFALVHMVNSTPIFALMILAPSLVFGYFRDHCNSIYPSIIIHSSYNAMVFVGLILHGNTVTFSS
jgi:membrane protease YdiL (CAAX protease family)